MNPNPARHNSWKSFDFQGRHDAAAWLRTGFRDPSHARRALREAWQGRDSAAHQWMVYAAPACRLLGLTFTVDKNREANGWGYGPINFG